MGIDNIKSSFDSTPVASPLAVHDDGLPALNTDIYRRAGKILREKLPPKQECALVRSSEGKVCLSAEAVEAIVAVMSLEARVDPSLLSREHQQEPLEAELDPNKDENIRVSQSAASCCSTGGGTQPASFNNVEQQKTLNINGATDSQSLFKRRGCQPLCAEVFAALLIPPAARYLFPEETRAALDRSEANSAVDSRDRVNTSTAECSWARPAESSGAGPAKRSGSTSVEISGARPAESPEAGPGSAQQAACESDSSLSSNSCAHDSRVWPLALPRRTPDGGCAVCERLNKLVRDSGRRLQAAAKAATDIANLNTRLKSLKDTTQSARLHLAEHHVPAGMLELAASGEQAKKIAVLDREKGRMAVLRDARVSVAAVSNLASTLGIDGEVARVVYDVEV
jgi:hypothetical protein